MVLVRRILVLQLLVVGIFGAVLSFDAPFAQLVSQRMTFAERAAVGAWPALPARLPSDVAATAASHQQPGGVYLLSPSAGLFFLTADNELVAVAVDSPTPDGDVRPLRLDAGARIAGPTADGDQSFQWDLVVASGEYVARCLLRTDDGLALHCPAVQLLPRSFAGGHSLNDVAMSGQGHVWLATDHGLWYSPPAADQLLLDPSIGAVAVERLALHSAPGDRFDLAASSGAWLWRLHASQHTSGHRSPADVWHSWYLDDRITTIGFGRRQQLWIGVDADALLVQDEHFVIRSYTGHQLPFGRATAIGHRIHSHADDSGVWIGTTWGLLYHSNSNSNDINSNDINSNDINLNVINSNDSNSNVINSNDSNSNVINSNDSNSNDINSNDDWRYLNGPRWLPTSAAAPFRTRVRLVCVVTGSDDVDQAVVVTEAGVARLRMEQWTLAQKAEHMQALMAARHEYYGQSFDCQLARYGDVASCRRAPDDSAGLLTGVYLAAQAFRYAATGSPEARAEANHAFQAVRFLQRVSGSSGRPARCFARAGDAGTLYNPFASPGDTWYNSSAYPGWVYKGAAPADHLVGHQLALVAFYKLVAQQADERLLARQLALAIVDRLLADNYTLTGSAEQDSWHPQRLLSTAQPLLRELRSLQLLTWLTAAHAVSQNSSYAALRQRLVDDARLDVHAINQRVGKFGDVPDAIVWLLYSTWLLAEPAPAYDAVLLGIERTVELSLQDRLSSLTPLYLLLPHARRRDSVVRELTSALQTWPLEQIDWPVDNSQRHDIVWSVADRTPEDGLASRLRLDELPLDYLDQISPPPLRRFGHHDQLLAHGGTGFREKTAATWLLSYWMSRYCGLFTA